jgi:hypothetical protein
MDALFAANVPDLSAWGTFVHVKRSTPRKHLHRSLDISVQASAPNYQQIIHELSRCIASARLDIQYLQLWENAVNGTIHLSTNDQSLIARALARGICAAGTVTPTSIPVCNDDHFKGHLVEVIHYCIRIFLLNTGKAHPLIFEPSLPKASPTIPGIDLLEVGGIDGRFHFFVWECKGTDASAVTALNKAAAQLCSPEGTAQQSFMEAYRCLQTADILNHDHNLAQFVAEMPRAFYDASANEAKRFGGMVGTSMGSPVSVTSFVGGVGDSVSDSHQHCQVVVVRIKDFDQFRRDVFGHLWNIF